MDATSGTVAGDRADEIVVAVDGSPASRAALIWAVREARSTGQRVCAVRVFDPTYLYSPPAAVFASIAVARTAEREALHDSVAGTVGDPEGVALREELLQGVAATELIARSTGAAMLVMGSHGRSRVGTTFLGSVGAACVHQADCPVLILSPKAAEALLAEADSALGSDLSM